MQKKQNNAVKDFSENKHSGPPSGTGDGVDVVLLLGVEILTVDIPGTVLAGVGTCNTDAVAGLTVANAEIGLVERKSGVNVRQVHVASHRVLPETPLPLQHLLLASVTVGDVVDAKRTSHLRGVRGMDKNVVEMLQEVTRDAVGQVDIGVSVDKIPVAEQPVDTRKFEGLPSEVFFQHKHLTPNSLVVLEQRRIGGMVVDNVEVVVAASPEPFNEVAESSETVEVVDDDGNLFAINNLALSKKKIAKHKTVIETPVLETVQGVHEFLPQR